MKPLFIALGFFTRLPVPKIEFTEERYRKSLKFVPLVGLVVGALLLLLSLVISVLDLPYLIRGALLTCVYIFITGGLHFDGVADTCDGVFSGRSREQSLEIMKDSRIGVFGTLGLFMVGLLYFVFLAYAPAPALLVFPVCGRVCCLISASLAPYARDDGMGKGTSAGTGTITVVIGGVTLVGACFLTLVIPPLSLLLACMCAILVTVWVTASIKKRLGGVTGDTFGAVIEISSLSFLLFFTVLSGVLPI